VKYWKIIADRLSKAAWSLGWVSALDLEGPNNLDGRRASRWKAFYRPCRRKAECIFGTAKGDSPVRGGFELLDNKTTCVVVAGEAAHMMRNSRS